MLYNDTIIFSSSKDNVEFDNNMFYKILSVADKTQEHMSSYSYVTYYYEVEAFNLLNTCIDNDYIIFNNLDFYAFRLKDNYVLYIEKRKNSPEHHCIQDYFLAKALYLDIKEKL